MSKHFVGRRGLTLTELMIALVVFGMVAGAIGKFMINSQRLSRAQVERISLQSNIRTGALVVPSELRELETDGSGSDIISMGSNAITFRAMRGFGFTCQVSATEIRIANSGSVPYYGTRYPATGRDSIMVFVETDPDDPADDVWLALRPTGVDLSSTCGSQPAIRVTVSDFSSLLLNGMTDVAVGGPVRSFEVMQVAQYFAGGGSWLGARSMSAGDAALYPVVGPLTANGVQFDYYNSSGALTSNPNQVRRIRMILRGLTEHAVSRSLEDTPAVMQDSLVASVMLRNAG